ncbi:hypothetical protein NEDG_02222 [Nematocida displodere]|uniref:Glycosyl transferase family 1 domain-containing protein n=1 Tax=Nematocida displodere TaxID=1805483 RepID=A0A177EKN4_9MICR|nr:hypothetical protein NEDG_02222 [Nematocida displodere]
MILRIQIIWALLLWVGASFQTASEATPKLKIAVVSTYPPTGCGIAEFTRNMAKSIVQASPENVEIHVYSTSKVPHTAAPALSPGVFVKRIRYTKKREAAALRRMAKEINNGGFDALLVQHEDGLMHNPDHFTSFLQLVSPKIKTYVFIHTGLPYPDMTRRNRYKKLAAYTDGIIALGWKVKKSLRHAYGISDTKVHYFPHGVTTAGGKPKKNKNKFVVLMGGIMKKDKGTYVAIKALELLKKRRQLGNLVLEIVGKDNKNGQHYRAVMAQVRQKGLSAHIRWTFGFTSLKELTRRHLMADVFLAPFLGEVPTSGTLTFAMSCGLPVVATPFGMSGELLGLNPRVPEGSSGGTSRKEKEMTSYTNYGAVVPYSSASAVADALHTLMTKPKMRREMGRNAKKMINMITWKKVGKSLHTYLVEKNTPPPLLPCPYQNVDYNSTCQWIGENICDFDKEKTTPPQDGAYVLYTDPFVAINGMVQKGKITRLAVRVYQENPTERGAKCNEAFVYASKKKLPIILPGSTMTKKLGGSIQIMDPGNVLCKTEHKNGLEICTPNVTFLVSPNVGGWINLKFIRDNRFGYARGLLGMSLMKKYSFPNVTILPHSAWELKDWFGSAFSGNPKTTTQSRYTGLFYGAPKTPLKAIQQGNQTKEKYQLTKLLASGKEGGALRKSFVQSLGNPDVSVHLRRGKTPPKKTLATLSLEQYVVLDYVHDGL